MTPVIDEPPPTATRSPLRATGFWRLIALPGSLWLVALYVVPLALLIAVAFTTADIVGRPLWGTFTLQSFTELADPIYIPVAIRTFAYALAVSAIALVAGYVVAYTISRYAGRMKVLLVVLVLLPWLVDYLIRIYAWMQLMGGNGLLSKLGIAGDGASLLGTDAAVIIGLVYNVLPLMVLPIFVSIEAVDPRLEEACRDLNGDAWAAFRYVTLPASVPGIASGATICFLLTFGDFVTAKMLGGPDQYMLGNVVQDQFSGLGAMPFGAAVTVCLLVVILAVLGLFAAVSRNAERRMQ